MATVSKELRKNIKADVYMLLVEERIDPQEVRNGFNAEEYGSELPDNFMQTVGECVDEVMNEYPELFKQ